MRTDKLFKTLALAIGGIALLGLVLNLTGANTGIPVYVAVSGLILALAIAMPFSIGAFMRFFIVFYGAGYLGLMAIFMASPLLPEAIAGFLPPPLTDSLFSEIVHHEARREKALLSSAVMLTLWNQENDVRVIQRRLNIDGPIVEVFSNDPRLRDLRAWDPSAEEAVA